MQYNISESQWILDINQLSYFAFKETEAQMLCDLLQVILRGSANLKLDSRLSVSQCNTLSNSPFCLRYFSTDQQLYKFGYSE